MNQLLSEIHEKYMKIIKSANLIGFLTDWSKWRNLTDSQPLDRESISLLPVCLLILVRFRLPFWAFDVAFTSWIPLTSCSYFFLLPSNQVILALVMGSTCYFQWRIQDFLGGGLECQLPKLFLTKTAWKKKEVGPPGGVRLWHPPWNHQCLLQVQNSPGVTTTHLTLTLVIPVGKTHTQLIHTSGATLTRLTLHTSNTSRYRYITRRYSTCSVDPALDIYTLKPSVLL